MTRFRSSRPPKPTAEGDDRLSPSRDVVAELAGEDLAGSSATSLVTGRRHHSLRRPENALSEVVQSRTAGPLEGIDTD
jgi:hypothetical protein